MPADSSRVHYDAQIIGSFAEFFVVYGDKIAEEFTRFTKATFSGNMSSSSITLAQKHPFDRMFDCIWSWSASELKKLGDRMQLSGLNNWPEFTQLIQMSLVKQQDNLSRAASIMMSTGMTNQNSIRQELVDLNPVTVPHPTVNQVIQTDKHSASTTTQPRQPKRVRQAGASDDQPPSRIRRVDTEAVEMEMEITNQSIDQSNSPTINLSAPPIASSSTSNQLLSATIDEGSALKASSELSPYSDESLDDGQSIKQSIMDDSLPPSSPLSAMSQEQQSELTIEIDAVDVIRSSLPLSKDVFLCVCDYLSLDEQNTKLALVHRDWLQAINDRRLQGRMWGQVLDLNVTRHIETTLVPTNVLLVPDKFNNLVCVGHASSITLRWPLFDKNSSDKKAEMIKMVLDELVNDPRHLNKLVIHETFIKDQPSFIASLLKWLEDHPNDSQLDNLVDLELFLTGFTLSLLEDLSWKGLSALKELNRFSLVEKFQSGTQAYLEKVLVHLPPTIITLGLDRSFGDSVDPPRFDSRASKFWQLKFSSAGFLPNLQSISGSIQLHVDSKALHAVLQNNQLSQRDHVIRSVHLQNLCLNHDWSVEILSRFSCISTLELTLKNKDQLQRLVDLEAQTLSNLRVCVILLQNVKQEIVEPLMTFLAQKKLTRLELSATLVSKLHLNDHAVAQLRTLRRLVELILNGFQIMWDGRNLQGCWPQLRELDLSSCTFGNVHQCENELKYASFQQTKLEQMLMASEYITIGGVEFSGLRIFKSSGIDPASVISALYRCCPFVQSIELDNSKSILNPSLKLTHLQQAWRPHPDNPKDYPVFPKLFSLRIAQSDDDAAVHFLISKLVAAPRLAYFTAPGNNRAMSLRTRLKHLQGLAPSEVTRLQAHVREIYSSCVQSGFIGDMDESMPNWFESTLTGQINGWGKKHYRFLTCEDGCDGRSNFFSDLSGQLSQADRKAIEAWDRGNYDVDVRPVRIKRQAEHRPQKI